MNRTDRIGKRNMIRETAKRSSSFAKATEGQGEQTGGTGSRGRGEKIEGIPNNFGFFHREIREGILRFLREFS